MPSGSSNATTSDEWLPVWRADGWWTQLGFWVTLSLA